jgi:hypothetical protein
MKVDLHFFIVAFGLQSTDLVQNFVYKGSAHQLNVTTNGSVWYSGMVWPYFSQRWGGIFSFSIIITT